MWLFVVVLGFSWWASLPLTSALTADVYGLRHVGTLNGVVFLGHQMGGAVSIQLGGLLHDLTGSYALPFAGAGLLLFIARLSSLTMNERKYAMGYETGPHTIRTRRWRLVAVAERPDGRPRPSLRGHRKAEICSRASGQGLLAHT